MMGCISAAFSISMRFPLSRVMYLLTADWDKPRILAVWFSFIPCFSTITRAIMALTASKIVLTPTSQGSNKFLPLFLLFCGKNYLKMTHGIFMTRVMGGKQ
jgi:hypothetical protein